MRPFGSSLVDCGCFPVGRHYPGIADRLRLAVPRSEVSAAAALTFADADPWSAQPLAVIDFETTGLDPQQERILEIGIACFDNGQLSASHCQLIQPGIAVPEAARKVHGIGDEDLAGAPTFAEYLDELRNMLAGRLPVAYNAAFDRSFLHAELRRAGVELAAESLPAFSPQVTWVDPLIWVRELQKYERGKKLTEVCQRLGIPLDQAHRAAADAVAAGHVLFHLVPQLPSHYAELIRLQTQYAARQELEFAQRRGRRG